MSDVVPPSWGGDFICAPQIYRHIKVERAFDEHFKSIATLFCLSTFAVAHHLVKLVLAIMDGDAYYRPTLASSRRADAHG